MSYLSIPLDAVPNQTVQVQLGQETWEVTLETRLEELYISLSNRTDGVVLLNRVCRDRTLVSGGFFFYDVDGIENPVYTGLGGRYVLVWTDELS